MNAVPKPANDAGSDIEAGYRASVAILYPETDDLTTAIRVRLMAVRDRASLALNRCCDEAIPTLMEANRLASLAALSSQNTRTLAFTLSAVESLLFAAQMMQRGSQNGR